jgi:hypothetical protein
MESFAIDVIDVVMVMVGIVWTQSDLFVRQNGF